MKTEIELNENNAAYAFSGQSKIFDKLFNHHPVIQYKRERVRNLVNKCILSPASILELNCGTGEDAIYFAQMGYCVHATDHSPGMISVLEKKARDAQVKNLEFELCSFTDLGSLTNKGPFDLIFSNFGGLNCTDKLEKVLMDADNLLKPGGYICFTIISRFCLWETLLIFKGKFKTATRRFYSRKGRQATIERVSFNCWYYNPSFIIKRLKTCNVSTVEGLCSLVPPSYLESFPFRYPKAFAFLKKMEDKLKSVWPFNIMGDYFIITLQKAVHL